MPDPVAIHSIILIVAAVAAMGEGGYSLYQVIVFREWNHMVPIVYDFLLMLWVGL
jgi:hypothetical protein